MRGFPSHSQCQDPCAAATAPYMRMTAIVHALLCIRIIIRQGNGYADICLLQVNWKRGLVYKSITLNECIVLFQDPFHTARDAVRNIYDTPETFFFHPVHCIPVCSAGKLPESVFFICLDHKRIHVFLPLHRSAHHASDHHLLHGQIKDQQRQHTQHHHRKQTCPVR